MFKRIILMLMPLAIAPVASAQDFQKIFDDFRKSNQQEFDSFADKANKEYAEFLRKGWEWFEGKEPVSPPVQEEMAPPVVVPEEELKEEKEDKEIQYEVVPEPDPVPEPVPIEPVQEVPDPASKTVVFDLYGTRCTVRFDMDSRPFLKGSPEEGLAGLWEEFCFYEGLDNLLFDLYGYRESLNLCDWAYYKCVRELCRTVYPDNSTEAGLMQAFILTQSGFTLRLGLGSDGAVYPLMAAECALYDYPYYEIQGQEFYVLEETGDEDMMIMTVEFPAPTHPMRISLEQENMFAENISQTRTLASQRYPEMKTAVSSNLNLISFFDEYPLAFVNNDLRTRWRFYANVPISAHVRKSVYPEFRRLLTGMDELSAVNVLLNFVQTAFVYEYDDKVWGTDRSFFADESLYYPYCDCEDRSVLFSRLVRDLLGLDVVLLYYPGHLATAVKFSSEVSGDYITYDGARYTICDPTYINAGIGEEMPQFKNVTPSVIKLKKL